MPKWVSQSSWNDLSHGRITNTYELLYPTEKCRMIPLKNRNCASGWWGSLTGKSPSSKVGDRPKESKAGRKAKFLLQHCFSSSFSMEILGKENRIWTASLQIPPFTHLCVGRATPCDEQYNGVGGLPHTSQAYPLSQHEPEPLGSARQG